MPQAPVIEVMKSDVAVAAVEQAAEVLRQGGLVVIPTETVYGVAVSAFSEAGLSRLVEAKQRASKKPFTAAGFITLPCRQLAFLLQKERRF